MLLFLIIYIAILATLAIVSFSAVVPFLADIIRYGLIGGTALFLLIIFAVIVSAIREKNDPASDDNDITVKITISED